MSQAFVKEIEDNVLLHQVEPTIPALVNYIKAGNNQLPVFVKQINKVKGMDVFMMSNGLSYFINNEQHWEMCL